ncbi:hypothetical protein SAMN05421805_12790 [Saccharopolyspora antimicrobica]|uniref:Scaffolding protein n=1 Tax=Saccharopolyspora antimicrobica TaxID=455193 RepID=A0A1I5KNJ9_9PSEU|nr:hypothetical protein [Saccharopolyspora antimicrobica]RKT85607.1 hypothetical protein ATL45_3954 [Saccharopolyspora antimicrobica]SFO86403.1 hypothetical protein SAMN05421805_12790 [Saccharopolyspora antimicrobica]
MLDNLPIHPTTGLRALGWTSRGPIWPVLGGNGEGDGDTGDQPPTPDEGQQQPPADSGKDGNGGQDQGDGDELAALEPAKLAAMVRKLRSENASERTNAKQQAADEARTELAQTIGRALGLIADDEPADPAKLAEQLTAERDAQTTAAREAAVELAVWKNAAKHGADPTALTDSRAFLSKLDKLDPAAEDFTAKVGEAIKKAVADNPRLSAAGQAPARSSSQHTGGTGGTAKPASLTDAVAARYGRA